MKEKVLIIGAGPHARSVIDIILQLEKYEIVGCLDPIYPKQTTVSGTEEISIIGKDDSMQYIFQDGCKKVFVAIGNNGLRKKLFSQAIEIGFEPINVISPFAYISPRAKLNKGICVMAGACINVNSVVGDNCIINTNCSIDHDCIIGDHVHIAPGVAMSGTVAVGEGVQIGTGTNIIECIKIGEWSQLGAGSTVVNDLPGHILAFGNPARIIKNI